MEWSAVPMFRTKAAKRRWTTWTLKMEATPQKRRQLFTNGQARHIQQDSNLHQNHCEDLLKKDSSPIFK
jgi:hypothetical protein